MKPSRKISDPDWFHGRTEKGSQGWLPISFVCSMMSEAVPILNSECLWARELVWMTSSPQVNVNLRRSRVSTELKQTTAQSRRPRDNQVGIQ